MVVRISDKTQNYSKVTKLLVKPFIFLQTIQVIIPIVPGGASSALGITAFGAVNGFIYNYIGICIGSIYIF